MKATLANYRQSPRKVRLVANLVRGKRIPEAEVELMFLPKRAAEPVLKLLRSAVANTGGISKDSLFIKEISVNKGVVLKRFMPRARGAGARINKRSSHITIVLGEKAQDKTEKSKEKKVKAKSTTKSKK